MTVTTAIALARTLWPAVTEAAASTVFLTAWYASAVRQAGEVWFGVDQQEAVAHLLAHYAYKLDPGGLLGGAGASRTGTIASMTTGRRSISWAQPPGIGSLSAADAALATTAPGLEYLALRARSVESAPFFVEPC